MTNARQSRSAREKSAAMQAEAAKAAARRRVLGVAAAVVAAIVVLVGATVVIRTAQENADKEVAVATPANTTNGAFIDGDDDAPVTMKIYSDFLCPICAQFHQENQEQIAAWVKDGTVRVEYKPISILDDKSADDYSTRSANAAASVANSAPDSWVAYYDLLFGNQPAEGGPGLTDDQLVDLAVQAGATESAVRPAIDGKTYSGWVSKMTQEATDGPDKVTGTPAVYVDGKLVENWAADKLKAAVDEAAAN